MKKGLVDRPGQRLRNAPAKLLQDVLVVSFAVKYLKHQEKNKKSVFIYEWAKRKKAIQFRLQPVYGHTLAVTQTMVILIELHPHLCKLYVILTLSSLPYFGYTGQYIERKKVKTKYLLQIEK